MEQLSSGKAMGWLTSFEPKQLKSYPAKIDSMYKQHGRYSMSIQKVTDDAQFGVLDYPIKRTFHGSMIQLRGYIKTENVKNYAGLWLRIDGTDKAIAFDNMQRRPIKGTHDWQEYVIDLNYDSQKAVAIHAGALLVGSGKIWLDNIRIFIDGKPIDELLPIARQLSDIEKDTAFKFSSKIDHIPMNTQQINNLTALAQVWGFLKYHHPAVALARYNWDAELFRILPTAIKANDNKKLSDVLEKWIDRLTVPSTLEKYEPRQENDVQSRPDYGLLFSNTVLSSSLTKKLSFILTTRHRGSGYYIDMSQNGNPIFLNESPYTKMTYPDAGYRLLSLFRYWNMIQYFYPYKYLTGKDWNNVLIDFIPKFINSANATEYTLNTLSLIAQVHDTHANIDNGNETLFEYEGKFGTPFRANFVENELVITGYYNDTLNVKQDVKPGDIIKKINGVTVPELIKKYLPYTPASNYATQLRDMPAMFLLRSNSPVFALDIIRDGKSIYRNIKGMQYSRIHYWHINNQDQNSPGHYLINNQIGYVYPGKYKNDDLAAIEKEFEHTKGLIIDLRCYPSDFMIFTFVPYIKADDSGFVRFTTGSLDDPGLFSFNRIIRTPALKKYKGKVIVIVNEQTQSQAEYTTMALQSSPNVTVIGSQTAGADGDVSSIVLPGGIHTKISGLGVFYPDGTSTQRTGVKINVAVKPTIKGIKAGKDEMLDMAKQIIMGR